MRYLAAFALVSVFSGCGCGDDAPPAVDGGADVVAADVAHDIGRPIDSGVDAPPDSGADARVGLCGNDILEGDEECDDGNRESDDACNSDCRLSCGDGEVNIIEICDTGIAEGEDGACPSTCDDENACTTDTLSGAECTAECTYGDIAMCTNGDGCCPAGCTAVDDDDCEADCGNGVVEAGETCEPAAGIACPTACNDSNTCTVDALVGSAATCDARCEYTAITMCTAGDLCCASGCTAGTDTDCSSTCGNMLIEPPETCDNGSAVPCPTACDDGDACTADALVGTAAMCNVMCSTTPITACAMAADGCCPSGCNQTNDGDCEALCGNRVVEAGEDCDDGNMVATDGCDMCMRTSTPTAFRMTSFTLRDPHVFTEVGICLDVTTALNNQVDANMNEDGDGDGDLDLSYLVVFRPLDQTSAGGMLELTQGNCSFPRTGTMCTPFTMSIATSTYTNTLTGTTSCLNTLPGGASAVRPYAPAVATPMPPCFASTPQTVVLSLSGVDIPLQEAQIAGSYIGSPATGISNGLIRGFLREADADVVIPDSIAFVGGMPLESLLRGGMGNCDAGSDMDTHPVHGMGWWLFLNFPGTEVPFSEP